MKNSTLSELSAAVNASRPETVFDWPPRRRRASYCGQTTALDGARTAATLLSRLPGECETFHAVMLPEFNMADLLPALLELAGQPAQWCCVFTLGWNRATVEKLCRLKTDGQIKSAVVIASKYFSAADKNEFESGKTRLEQAGIATTAARSHVKACLMDFGKIKISVLGSGNFRTARCIENLTITGNPATFELFRLTANNIINTPNAYDQHQHRTIIDPEKFRRFD